MFYHSKNKKEILLKISVQFRSGPGGLGQGLLGAWTGPEVQV